LATGAPCLQFADDGGKVGECHNAGFGIGRLGEARLRQFLERRAAGVGGEQQVHVPIVPCWRLCLVGGLGLVEVSALQVVHIRDLLP
jgi:hypothetical protein